MEACTLTRSLLRRLAEDSAVLPAAADVILLQQPDRERLHMRARRFVALLQDHGDCGRDHGSAWQADEDQTTIHLPNGARAIVVHASGALRYVSGLAPLSQPFSAGTGRQDLLDRLVSRARAMDLAAWCGARDTLRFERLFQRRAAGMDREGRPSPVTLLRAIGAWRRHIGDIPVLGAASATLTLAGSGRVDGLRINIRPGNGEVFERAALLDPETGARRLLLQLSSLLNLGSGPLPAQAVESASMLFGYLDLGKRRPQRLLAPAYVAQVVLRHRHVRQACVLAVAATEKPYLELPLFGSEALVTRGRPGPGAATERGNDTQS